MVSVAIKPPRKIVQNFYANNRGHEGQGRLSRGRFQKTGDVTEGRTQWFVGALNRGCGFEEG
jgi:hypothetical protein